MSIESLIDRLKSINERAEAFEASWYQEDQYGRVEMGPMWPLDAHQYYKKVIVGQLQLKVRKVWINYSIGSIVISGTSPFFDFCRYSRMPPLYSVQYFRHTRLRRRWWARLWSLNILKEWNTFRGAKKVQFQEFFDDPLKVL